MEDILGVKMRPPISLYQFLTNYRNALAEYTMPNTEEDIQKAMQLENDIQRFVNSSASCSLGHLDQNDDAHILQFTPGFSEMRRKIETQFPAEALKLQSFKAMLESKETITRNPFQKSQEIFKLVKLPKSTDRDEMCKFYNDLIVTIRVYRPARATHIGKSLEKPVFAEEFECLGSNLLTELRDRISCVCNKHNFFDISKSPESALPTKTTDPGYFFITDTFYNDKRDPDSPDYSEVIRNWATKVKGLSELEFKVAKMEDTRFIDLTVSLGFPQLYQHHGNCEHVFVFSQVEVITPGALCTSTLQYPRMRSFSSVNNRICNMCGIQHYVFIVEQSDRQLHDPAYLCSKCFESYHYIDGKKIGNFKAYRVNNYKDPTVDEDADNAETLIEAEFNSEELATDPSEFESI